MGKTKTTMGLRSIGAAFRHKYRQLAAWQEHGSPIKEMDMTEMTCKHCGTTYQGNFCPRCGQTRKVSLITKRGFFAAFMEAYPQLASAFMRTLKELVGRPGYMIRDYFRGHRVIYFGPFKAFIVVVSIFVLLTKFNVVTITHEEDAENEIMTELNWKMDSVSRAYNVKQDSTFHKLGYRRLMALDKRIGDNEYVGTLWETFKKKTDEKGSIYILVCVPILAFAMKLACWRQRFDNRKLIFAEHFMVFTYLYVVNVFFSLIYCLFTHTTAYPDTLIFFYMIWTYKGLYGWGWRKTLMRMVPFFLWSALFFILAVFAFGTAIIILVESLA